MYKYGSEKIVVLIFIGFLSICGGIGYLSDHTLVGMIIGIGVGSIVTAMYLES